MLKSVASFSAAEYEYDPAPPDARNVPSVLVSPVTATLLKPPTSKLKDASAVIVTIKDAGGVAGVFLSSAVSVYCEVAGAVKFATMPRSSFTNNSRAPPNTAKS